MKLVKEGLQDSLEFNQWINAIIAEIRVILEDDSERSEKLIASDIKDDPFETHDKDIEEMFMNNVDPAEAANVILDIMFKEIDSRFESLKEELRDWPDDEDYVDSNPRKDIPDGAEDGEDNYYLLHHSFEAVVRAKDALEELDIEYLQSIGGTWTANSLEDVIEKLDNLADMLDDKLKN